MNLCKCDRYYVLKNKFTNTSRNKHSSIGVLNVLVIERIIAENK